MTRDGRSSKDQTAPVTLLATIHLQPCSALQRDVTRRSREQPAAYWLTGHGHTSQHPKRQRHFGNMRLGVPDGVGARAPSSTVPVCVVAVLCMSPHDCSSSAFLVRAVLGDLCPAAAPCTSPILISLTFAVLEILLPGCSGGGHCTVTLNLNGRYSVRTNPPCVLFLQRPTRAKT